MITFASLILALVVGVQPVEVVVSDEVAEVEIRLDGRLLGSLTGPPWTFPCDFGHALEPHHLEALALDANGKELGRAEQWINVPRGRAEAGIVLEQAEDGEGAVAHLTWNSLAGEAPIGIEATFDGAPLPTAGFRRIRLPPFDPDQIHFLRVELRFPEGPDAVVETTFGGVYADRVNTELTAIPVVVERPKKLPSIQQMAAWFVDGDEPLRVLAVERGFSEIVLVRDLAAQVELERVAADFTRQQTRYSGDRGLLPPAPADVLRAVAPLDQKQRLRFVSSFAERQEREGYGLVLFPPSRDFSRSDGGLLWLLSEWRPALEPLAEQRLADAVAAAALSAALENRRRAVVLILSAQPSDASQLTAEQVRGYLGSLRVPLEVWTTAEDLESAEWGPATSISSLSRLEKALARLERDLDRQRIVWLEGLHLPQSVSLAPAAAGIHLVE